MSVGGMPNSTVQFASITVVGLIGAIYYGLRVRRSGFGTYRHLLPLVFNQSVLTNSIAIIAIAISAMGVPNIYDSPEFIPPFLSTVPSSLTHAMAHLFIGNIGGTLSSWGLASLAMLIAGRPQRRAEGPTRRHRQE